MNTPRAMSGLIDHSGTEINGVKIGEMVQRSPEPTYETKCACGARGTASQTAIRQNAIRCTSSEHGVSADRNRRAAERRQVQLSETQQRVRDAAAALDEAKLAASRAALDAEMRDYKLPASRPKRRPTVAGPMSERERQSLRGANEELEADERKVREEREQPVREAEAKLTETHRKLFAIQRSTLLGEVKDADVFADPALSGKTMSAVEADAFNRSHFRSFRSLHPEVYFDNDLVGRMGTYFEKNGLALISAPMLERLVARYSEAGLLPDPPAPELEPEQAADPESQSTSALSNLIDGWDVETGEPKQYTERQLGRLSSDAYRRALHICTAPPVQPHRF